MIITAHGPMASYSALEARVVPGELPVLDDGDVLAVAAAFQDGSASGMVLAGFASTGMAVSESLLDAVGVEFREVCEQPPSPSQAVDATILAAVAAWIHRRLAD